MDKRYQVFISSTFTDLEDERRKVYQSILEMDCIPAGMELFPALDEEQFNFIKKIIDDSDYYVLIIGGRYGTISSDGVSYTEKEYDYAVSKGIKVIALLHDNPQNIPASKTERSSEGNEKLEQFRKKVATGRLVRGWSTADQLPGLVTTSLNRTMKTYPATGWVRGNVGDSTELLRQINELRIENEALKASSSISLLTKVIGQAVPFDKNETIPIRYRIAGTHNRLNVNYQLSKIFSVVAPTIMIRTPISAVKSRIETQIIEDNDHYYYDEAILDKSDFDNFCIKMSMYGLVDYTEHEDEAGVTSVHWKITERGMQFLLSLHNPSSS